MARNPGSPSYHGTVQMSSAEFEEVVADALDQLPLSFAELLENIVVQVREAPDHGMIESVGLDPRHHTLFGLYTGVPLDRRGEAYGNVLPDVVLLFRRPLLAACPTRDALIRQIQLTLLHEIGHHFGFSDEEMHAWDDEFPGITN